MLTARRLKREGFTLAASGAALIAAGLLIYAGLALAHEGADSTVRVVLDGTAPGAEGLQVQVYDDGIAPQVVLENKTGRLLEVMDEWGRAFLRIGPGGVEADFASPTWYRTLSPGGVVAPPAATPTSTPSWRKVRAQPSWGWFDRRLDPSTVAASEAIVHAGNPVALGSWRIAARLNGTPLDIQGHFQYKPAPPGVWRSTVSPGHVAEVGVTLSQGSPPALLLENRGRSPVVVLGNFNEPMLRIGPDGVEVNLASPTWQDQGRYRGLAPEPLAAAEEWRKVSPAPRYTWLEPRIERAGAGQRWQLPLQIDGRTRVIEGSREWVPMPDTAAVGAAAQ
jgi:hypothetical protein